MSLVRSVLAVLAGFFAAAILVVVADVTLGRMILGAPEPGGVPEPTPAYLLVNLASGLVAGIVGGWVVGRAAAARPVAHAAALGALFLVGSVVTGQQPGQPDWYPFVMPALGLLGAITGGKLYERGQAA